MNTNKEEKRRKKIVEKYWREYFSRKSFFLIWGFSLFVSFVALLHGLSESWAWEIAKTIITLDGVILGFTIIGVTLFSSERTRSTSRIVGIFRKHLKDFWKELRVVEVSNSENIKRRFVSSLESAITEAFVVPSTLPAGMKFLVISIAFALSLFGVSDATLNDIILRDVFKVLFSLSIVFMMLGIYFTFKFMEEIFFTSISIDMTESLEKSLETFIKEGEEFITKQKERKP